MALKNGPRSSVGKINSSRNALKKGIYSNSLLPGEDAQALESLADDLANRFDVEDAAEEILISKMLQNTLQSNRLQMAQTEMIQAKMHSMETRNSFCVQTGLSVLIAAELPDWFFDDDQDSRQDALEKVRIWSEAKFLHKNYSVDLILRARQEFPSLWKYLMGKDGSAIQKVHATLGERISTMYKHSSPQSNLQQLITEIEEKYKYALLYVKNESRYDGVIQGLRAKALLDVYADPNWSRAEAATHKRTNDLMSTLIVLQREKSKSSIIASPNPPAVLEVEGGNAG